MEILVAEDNNITRRLLKRVLERLGHQVLTARNGQEAWQRFQKNDIRVVISDWMMPQMDGLTLCRRMRAVVERQYVYIVILTAKDQKEDLIEVFRAGADDYITKPFDPEELRASLTKCERIVNLEERYRSLEHTLVESRNKLRIVFDSLQEEVVAVDASCNIVSANQSFLKGMPGSFGGVIGETLFGATPPRPAWKTNNVQRLVQEVFADKVPRQIREEIKSPDQRTVHKLIDGLPVSDETGKVFQVVLVSKDITEDRRKSDKIKKLNIELKTSSDQIQRKNSALEKTLLQLKETQTQILQAEKMASIGQLAAGVAHEINNPTGYVSSNLETLSKYQKAFNGLIDNYQGFKIDLRQAVVSNNQLPEQLDARLEQIEALERSVDIDFLRSDSTALIDESREGMERIKKIVLNLKDFAHPGQNRKKPADINRGLESTLKIVKNELKHKARVVKDFEALPEISCFPQQLNQVFMNILLNAAQAIPASGEIRIRTRLENEQVEIMIKDNGMGIEEENLSRVFDPFFTTKDVGEGTGLGMNIAYNIVKKHSGTIAVESMVGEGTTFTVRIPAI